MNGNQNIVFNCDKSATFGFKSLLEIHKKITAYIEYGVVHGCDNSFVGEQNLKQNLNIYQCNYCGIGFERVLDKLRHQKSLKVFRL